LIHLVELVSTFSARESNSVDRFKLEQSEA
jgi:hypothetical protein